MSPAGAERSSRSPFRFSIALTLLLLFIVYFVTGRIGLSISAVSGFATLIWAPTGIALAACLLLGTRVWPVIALGAFAVNLSSGAPLLAAFGIAFGNTLEAVLAAVLLKRFASFHMSLDRLSDVVMLIAATAMSSTVSASVGLLSLWVTGTVTISDFGRTWTTWWFGDVMGALVFAPFLLTTAAALGKGVRLMRFLVEAALLALTIILVNTAIFHDSVGDEPARLLKPYYIFPVLFWAAIRLKQTGAASITLLTAIIALWSTANGFGPFASSQLNQNLLHLQQFLAVFSVTGLFLAAAVSEREQSLKAQAILSEASSAINASLDYQETLKQIAHLTVPTIADGCIIDIIDEETNIIQRLITMHRDPEKETMMHELQKLYPPDWNSPQPAARVIRSKAPELLTEVNGAVRKMHTRDDRHAELIQQIGINSHLAVPMIIRGKTIGALSLLITSTSRRYDKGDVAFIVELTKRLAGAIDNARLYSDTQRAIKIRDEFISLASHELKTPLTALKLDTESLLFTLDKSASSITPEKLKKHLARTDKQTDRIAKLVDDMLDISRIRSGKLPLEPQQVDLALLARDVVDRLHGQLASKSSAITVEASGPVIGFWDPHRIEQVLINLLTNAGKYGQGGPILVSVQAEGDSARLAVTDTGLGIEPGDHKRIFQLFERAVPGSEISGLGLGLYIVKTIVDAHHGEIRVKSELGQGATFEVVLPLAGLGTNV